MKNLGNTLTGLGFQISLIEMSDHSASYLAQGLLFQKKFVQVISVTKRNDEFAIVEIFVSNLSVTEKWAEIEISVDVLGEYLKQMLFVSGQELSKTITGEEKFAEIVNAIDEKEPKLAAHIHELHEAEALYESKHTDAKLKKKIEGKLAKLEEDCLKEEIDISRLSFRYFTNSLDEIDPFFYQALFGVKWVQPSAKKITTKKTAAKNVAAKKSLAKNAASRKNAAKKSATKESSSKRI
jgi:hypothetical protein